MQVQPYVFFNGRCEEAIEFYREALGAEVIMMMRFSDAPPDPNRSVPPDIAKRIMHATLAIGTSHVLMSDGDGSPYRHNGFSLSLAVDNVKFGERYFNALSHGGVVEMPFQSTFWAAGFGIVTDRFGINWMVNVMQQQ
ncbi:Protein YjdN [Burkholderia diffusa]|uniref:VOC family protein n=1 Tax=Burkholderia diffusa TaxID=488732 RepID=UPI001CAF28F3|nr:VOC family protein [Burkholderia diffusa]CAG9247729.1 Protein YjdN [Burkholderia diffusa]